MINNQLIIDDRDTGKTTYLLSEIIKLHEEGKNIIILDSATEHEEKSLLKKTCKIFTDSVIIDMREANNIVLQKIGIEKFTNNFMNIFPYSEVNNNKNSIICFDLSYFLEKGHNIYEKTNSLKLYNYYRYLYNNLSQQIITSLVLMSNYSIIKDTYVIMDEIEFPIVNYDISLLQKYLYFIASVHPENAFGTFYSSFEKMNYTSYKKRKEN